MSRVFTTISSVLISTLGEMIIMKLAGAGVLARAHATHLVVINAVVMINPSKNKTRPNCYKLSLGAHSQELVYQAQPSSAERIVHCSSREDIYQTELHICREITKITTQVRETELLQGEGIGVGSLSGIGRSSSSLSQDQETSLRASPSSAGQCLDVCPTNKLNH